MAELDEAIATSDTVYIPATVEPGFSIIWDIYMLGIEICAWLDNYEELNNRKMVIFH